jgi:antitoxin (DNA-binding transcriptional repressor) of toxin-antitoxin stability system
MAATATVRELRNQFPKVRKLLEAEGEVVITEQGAPRYRLIGHTPTATQSPPAKDYMARLGRHQPRPIGAAAARALHEANRGER